MSRIYDKGDNVVFTNKEENNEQQISGLCGQIMERVGIDSYDHNIYKIHIYDFPNGKEVKVSDRYFAKFGITCLLQGYNYFVSEREKFEKLDKKDIGLEVKCPCCMSDMKEYVTKYKCRNATCNCIVKKYFQSNGE